MTETVIKAPLPVGEALVIQKNRIAGADPKSHRLSIVTGTHGDELEGQYVAGSWPGCWKKRKMCCVARWIFILP